jgi:hypothetical protein
MRDYGSTGITVPLTASDSVTQEPLNSSDPSFVAVTAAGPAMVNTGPPKPPRLGDSDLGSSPTGFPMDTRSDNFTPNIGSSG